MSRRKLSEIAREAEAKLGAKRIVELEIARLVTRLRQFETDMIESLNAEVGVLQGMSVLDMVKASASEDDIKEPTAYAYALEILAEGLSGVRSTLAQNGHLGDEQVEDVSSSVATVVPAETRTVVAPVETPVSPSAKIVVAEPVVVPPVVEAVAPATAPSAAAPIDPAGDPEIVDVTPARTSRPVRTSRQPKTAVEEEVESTTLLYGVTLPSRLEDKAEEIIARAHADKASGRHDPAMSKGIGKNAWRGKLYEAVFSGESQGDVGVDEDVEVAESVATEAVPEPDMVVHLSPEDGADATLYDGHEELSAEETDGSGRVHQVEGSNASIDEGNPSEDSDPNDVPESELGSAIAPQFDLGPAGSRSAAAPSVRDDPSPGARRPHAAAPQPEPSNDPPTEPPDPPPPPPKPAIPAFLLAPAPSSDAEEVARRKESWTDPYGTDKPKAAPVRGLELTQRRPNLGMSLPPPKGFTLEGLGKR